MHKVLVLGAGKIGSLISGLLAESGDYEVHVADVNAAVAAAGRRRPPASTTCTRTASTPATRRRSQAHLRAHPVDAVISSLPYYCNVGVAEAARQAGAHYFDLTEDVAVTRAVRHLADGADQAFVPAVRPRAGLHQHRRQRADPPLRRAAQREAARRRPAPAPEQRAQVLAHLVHRGPDQRVRQPLRGDRRRPRRRKSRRSRASRRSRSTARSTRRSTPPAASARSATPTASAPRSWTTRPSATRATASRCAC